VSLDKAIRYGKERRRVYRGAAAVDHSCRPGGSCPRCRSNRTWSRVKAEAAARAELDWWLATAAGTFDFWDNETDAEYDGA
jgi:hypothetical protein